MLYINSTKYQLVILGWPQASRDLLLRQRVFFFSPEFGHRPYQNSGTYRRVFLFHPNLVTNHTKIQGHTGGSFFFTRIWSPTIPKLWDIQRVFFFHQTFVTDHTKIVGHTGGSFFFTRILSPTIPKLWDIQRVFCFSPEFCHRPYQNCWAIQEGLSFSP